MAMREEAGIRSACGGLSEEEREALLAFRPLGNAGLLLGAAGDLPGRSRVRGLDPQPHAHHRHGCRQVGAFGAGVSGALTAAPLDPPADFGAGAYQHGAAAAEQEIEQTGHVPQRTPRTLRMFDLRMGRATIRPGGAAAVEYLLRTSLRLG